MVEMRCISTNVGIKRIKSVIGLMNLTYNMFRKVQLMG